MVAKRILATKDGVFLKNRQKKLLDLLESSGPGLHRLLTRLTFREEIAEELMQELFIKLSNYGGLDKVRNLGAFARTTAMNLAFDWRRRQKLATTAIHELSEEAAKVKAPLDMLVLNEELLQTLDAIEKLNPEARQVLVMRTIEKAGYEEISDQVGKSVHHIRGICHRARKQLKEILEKPNSQQPKMRGI